MCQFDPYAPTDPLYECPTCGARGTDGGACAECGVTLRNIAVPRE